MGGLGSGRHPGFPTTLDDFRTIEVGYLRRHGLLRPWTSGWLRWSRAGRETGSVGFAVGRDALTLTYRTRGHGDEGWTEVVEPVRLPRTAQPFGGERVWFACPGCGRRCAVLYGARRFRCRLCIGVSYGSQHEAAHERLLRRVQGLRARLGGELYASLDLPFPPRPKRMRRATYRRLRARAGRLERAMATAAAERFGLAAEELDRLS